MNTLPLILSDQVTACEWSSSNDGRNGSPELLDSIHICSRTWYVAFLGYDSPLILGSGKLNVCSDKDNPPCRLGSDKTGFIECGLYQSHCGHTGSSPSLILFSSEAHMLYNTFIVDAALVCCCWSSWCRCYNTFGSFHKFALMRIHKEKVLRRQAPLTGFPPQS